MNPSTDLIWGRYALNAQKITRAQLQLCIEEQGHLREKGVDKTLSQIMVEHKFIDEPTANQLCHLEGMIPGYYMKEILGAGGLGVVYRAFSEKFAKDVAIKLLNPEYTDNALVLNRFLREIDISKRLEHPNIVKGLDSGRVDDLYYLVMEYINGDNLATYVNKYGPMKEAEVLSVAVTVTNALCYAWQKGLTHRDIKPENILLTQGGSLKVCDFGLAKLADANVAITMSGTIVGSPYYISPEQVTGAVHLDYRSDIYSLGATLYFVVTGRMLFDEKTVIAFCNAHLNKEPVPPSRHATVSPAFDQLIARMLNKDPQRRCTSPEEFVSYLLSVITTAHPDKKIPEPIRPPQTPGSKETSVFATPRSPAAPVTRAPNNFEEETMEESFQSKDNSTRREKHPRTATGVSKELPIFDASQIKATTKSNIRKDGTPSQYPKTKIEDAILQHLLLSISIMDMSQFSQCMSTQVDLQLHGQSKSLAEIIVEEGYVEPAQMENLRLLRDKDGKSLLPAYEVIRPLGEGGVAIVYLARHITTNKTVALKVFAPSMSNNSSAIIRFMREAEAAKRLDHPNIVKADDFGTIYGIYYLAMEYIPGLSLSQIIYKVGRLEEKRALEILYQLAEALTYAWKQNIIHRDVKPGNILSDGEVFKICDLGLAKALEAEIQLTQEGNLIGTPQFMSPEQFQPEKDLDFRSDIYSLGVTFYVMLSGQLPFNANTKLGLAQAHLMKDPPPLERFDVRVSKPTRALLAKMMAKDPNLRCHEKDELLEDIWRVQQGKYPRHTSATPGLAKTLAIVTSLLLLLALTVIAGFFAYRQYWLPQREQQAIAQLIAEKRLAEARTRLAQSSLPQDVQAQLLRQISAIAAIEEREHQPPVIVPVIPVVPTAVPLRLREMIPPADSRLAQEQATLKGIVECDKLTGVWIDQKSAIFQQSGENLWRFEITLPLAVGRNLLQVTIEAGQQRLSQEHGLWRETVDITPPTITITQPPGLAVEQKYACSEENLIVKGYAADEEKVDLLWVNGQRIPVLVQDKQTLFETTLPLKEGEQAIVIRAKDNKGNEANFKFYAVVSPRGWFGEIMPEQLSRSAKIGEYFCASDNSMMVYVPAGEVVYGDDKNSRKIYLPGYYADKFEATWQQYHKFCKETGYLYPQQPSWGVKASHPVVNISPRDVAAYAKWCGKRIPTVVEWVKAARGGLKIPDWQNTKPPLVLMDNPLPQRLYPWGNDLPNALHQGEKVYRCNYCADDSFVGQASDGYMYSARVGDFAPWDSPYRCCDMAGNIAEICQEWPAQEEVAGQDKYYSVMGGAFLSLAKNCTVLSKEKILSGRSQNQTGFRLVK